jgi:lipoprotein signal peptidase
MFWCLALVGFAVDQGSKYGIFAWLYNDEDTAAPERRAIIPGAFYLHAEFTRLRDPGDQPLSALRTLGGDRLPHVNKGALWGIGRGRPGEAGTDFNSTFALVSVIAAVALIVWGSLPWAARDRFLTLALGLILAGTLGNLYDRVVFGGVRDFLAWEYLFDFPIFNIADCCLVCGAFLLLAQAFFGQEPAAEAPKAEAAPAEAPAQVAEVAQVE